MNQEHDRYDNIALACGHGPHVPASMVRELGRKFSVAGFMVQLLYEANRNRRGRGPVKAGTPFYKTVEEIEEETGIGRWGQETAKKVLVKKGWITIVRKGVPAKNYFTITRKFNMWNQGISEKIQKDENDKLKGGKTTYENNDDITASKNDALQRTGALQNSGLLQRQTQRQLTKNKRNTKETPPSPPLGGIVADASQSKTVKDKKEIVADFLQKWNRLAKQYGYKGKVGLTPKLVKHILLTRKTVKGTLGKGGMKAYWQNVEETMERYIDMTFQAQFTLEYATRPSNILEKDLLIHDAITHVPQFPVVVNASVLRRRLKEAKEQRQDICDKMSEAGDKDDRQEFGRLQKEYQKISETIQNLIDKLGKTEKPEESRPRYSTGYENGGEEEPLPF